MNKVYRKLKAASIRRVIAAETAVADKPPKVTSDLAKNVLGAIIGVVATVVVGDLLVKRNYEAAVAEYRAVDQEIFAASRDFDDLVSQVDAAVMDRRAASQMLSNYGVANNVNGYVDYYDTTYRDVVKDWNDVLSTLGAAIRKVTSCDQQSDIYKVADVLVDSRPPQNTNALSPEDAAREQKKLGWPSLCPDSFLFRSREYEVIQKEKVFMSVFEVFRYLHVLFADNRVRPIVTCYTAAQSIRQTALKACQPVVGRFWWLTVKLNTAQCILETSTQLSDERLCPDKNYRDLADIAEDRFATIDYLWASGRRLLKAYRSAYIQRRCEAIEGFWSTFRRRAEC